jgi:hypothetical protein
MITRNAWLIVRGNALGLARMSHNPYTPPAAVVADVETLTPLARPRHVTIAVHLLWITLVIGVPGAIYSLVTGENSAMSRGMQIAFSLVVWAISWTIAIWLLLSVRKGKNWARIVEAVFLGLGLLFAFWAVRLMFTMGWYMGGIYLLQTVLNTAAVALLFTPSSNAWFRAIKNQ